MKILVDCRCLNYPFLTGVNSYTIRLLHCLSIVKSSDAELKIVAMGCHNSRLRGLMTQFPFLINLFESHISLAQYLGYENSSLTQSGWFHKLLEIKLISKNWLTKKLDNSTVSKYDYVILPQPRLLQLHPDSKLITVFHDIFSILDGQKAIPQSIIFNKRTCQSLVDQSHKIIAGSISTCQDVSKVLFGQNGFSNPKIKLIYPALPKLQELQNQTNKISNQIKAEAVKLPLAKGLAAQADWGYKGDETTIQNEKSKILTDPYILAISGIEPRKNWHNLILAHKYLQDKYDWKLNLVLSGSIIDSKYYKKLIQIIAQHQIQNVIWHVNIDEQTKTQLIKNCEFVAYPSFYEGFGFPILEAFEYDKVVVTSRISSLPEIGKQACVYVNPYSYTSIANCMYLLQIDLDFKQSLIANIDKCKNKYCWDEMVKSLHQILV
jgi:glycosyltransferase involved in cell wall biosynthesis